MNRIIKVKFTAKKYTSPYSYDAYGATNYEFTGDGSRNTFAISFTCHKSFAGCLDNNAEISIYNVKPEAYNEIFSNYSDYRVALYVGHDTDGQLSLLMEGYLLRVWNVREGMDDKMVLNVYQYADRPIAEGSKALSRQSIEVAWTMYKNMTGLGASFTAPKGSKEWNAVFKTYYLSDFIVNLANRFSSLPENATLKVDKANIRIPDIEGKFSGVFKTRTFSGTFHGIMDTLAHEYGFTWSIQDDTLYVYMDSELDGGAAGREDLYIGPDVLMSCEPVLQGQFFMNQTGMKAKAILDARCRPGSVVRIESKIYPSFNGRYFVHEIDFSGSTISSDWNMSIESKTRSLKR